MIQQIISDSEREQFQLEDAKKIFDLLNARKDLSNNEEFQEINNETIDQLSQKRILGNRDFKS